MKLFYVFFSVFLISMNYIIIVEEDPKMVFLSEYIEIHCCPKHKRDKHGREHIHLDPVYKVE